MKDKIIKALKYYIDKGVKDFVIYPYGNYGKITKSILNNEFGIKEKYVVDNYINDQDVKTVEYLKEDYGKSNFKIIIAVDPVSMKTSTEVHREISSFADNDRIIDVLSWSPYFAPWNHYSEINTMDKPKIALIECIAREVYKNNINGSVAEAGVYKGWTARYINMFFPDRKLYLFDTFEGFNKDDQERDDSRNLYNMKIDYSKTSEELVLNRMYNPNKCVIKKGWFPETTYNIKDKFAFVRLDMDLYDPIYAGLQYFYPLMEKGGYIVVHDCRSENFDGARAALLDFCKEKNIGYMCMPDDLGSAVINIGL